MAALRAASQAWQEMDFAEAPALHSAGVEKRPSSGGDSGRSSRRCSVSLSSPTISEDAVSLAESMMASGATAELREAGRAGNEYIAVESSLTVYQDAGIELAGEDEGAINASGRAAQTRRRSGGLPLRKRLSASDLGVTDQDATDVEPLYDALSFPSRPISTVAVAEPFYLAPIARRRFGNKASGDNGADRQRRHTKWHAYDDLGCAPASPPSVPPPVADDAVYGQVLSSRHSVLLPVADDGVYGLLPPPSPEVEEQYATSCASEQTYEDLRLPLGHSYSIADSGVYDTPIQGIYEHICTVTHH